MLYLQLCMMCITATETDAMLPTGNSSWHQFFTIKYLLLSLNYVWYVHASYWDVLSNINYMLTSKTSHQCHIWSNTNCLSSNVTDMWTPVTGVYSVLSINYWNQCQSMKPIFHFINCVYILPIPVTGIHPVLSSVSWHDQCFESLLHIFNYVWDVHASNWDIISAMNYVFISMSLDWTHKDETHIAHFQLCVSCASQ